MGRRSSFSGSRGRTRPSPRQSSAMTAPRAQAPLQSQTKSPGFFSNMVGTMFTGMAFGAGSEVAHQGIRSMTGSNSTHQEAQVQAQQQTQSGQQQPNCQLESTNFIECLKFNSSDISKCQEYLTLMKTCEEKLK